MIKRLLVCAFVFVSINAYAATIRVPEDYSTIQAGIDAAIDGDTVLVASGTYYESINFNGKNITVKSQDGAKTTIIDGEGTSSTLVTFASGESQDAVLDGFTIRNSASYGICCTNSSASTIINNIVTDNDLNGIYSSSSPTIANNIVTRNDNDGIFCPYSSGAYPIITNNKVTANEGTGIFVGGPQFATITNNIVAGNFSYGISAGWTPVLIANNPVVGNAHGVNNYYSYSDSVTITNNIITSNGSFGISIDGSSSLEISYNNVWNNGEDTNGDGIGDIDYLGDATAGEGDICADPLFEAINISIPQDYPTIQEGLNAGTDNAFRLGQGSPCIDAASEGKNMGAYFEQQSYGLPGDFTVNVSRGIYTENLIVPIFVRLTGEDVQSTIIDGDKQDVMSFYYIPKTAEPIVSGFTIRNGNYGIYCFKASPNITNNFITDNERAGIYCYVNSSPNITNNIIVRNRYGTGWVSGIYCEEYCSPFIINNVIAENEDTGIYCFSSSPTIINNIISSSRYGIFVSGGGSDLEISYNNVWNNSSGDYYGQVSPGIGDISVNPVFVDSDNDDFHIGSRSPCIDAGTNDAVELPDTDFEGDDRILDGDGSGCAIVDMGADEVEYEPSPWKLLYSSLSIVNISQTPTDDEKVMYEIRDKVLNQSFLGKKLTKMMYAHAQELVELASKDTQLKQGLTYIMNRLVELGKSYFADNLSKTKPALDSKLTQEIATTLDKISKKASKGLRQDISVVRRTAKLLSTLQYQKAKETIEAER